MLALGFGVFNDTEACAIHLSFALLPAFAGYPACKSSTRNRVPPSTGCWRRPVAVPRSISSFLQRSRQRPGLPTRADIMVAVIGVLAVIEASRRAEGPWMSLFTLSFLVYVFTGPWLPGLLVHKGASLGRAASHFWLIVSSAWRSGCR
jgi:TRAP-type uncharacterized transport system fused permease subunit